MSDNVINFPRELNLNVEIEDEAQMIEGVGEMLDIFTQGLNAAHDVDPEIMMSAMMHGAAIWGVRAGMTGEDIMDMFKRMKIRLEEDYDG